MATDFDNFYVTFIDVDGDLLKVWGQRNRIGATYIERQLLQMLPDFNRTSGPDPSQIRKGMFCFAKYTDDTYYRARVLSDVQGDSVGVLFVDYGNRDIIKISNIRLQQGKEDVLSKMSEQAEEYYLARVMAPHFGWTKEVVGAIRRDICYDEFRSLVVAHIGDQKIMEIEFRNEDFSDYLIKKQIVRPLQLTDQKQMILSYRSLVSKSETLKEKMNFSLSIPPPNIASFKPQNSMTESDAFHFSRSRHPANFLKPPTVHYPPSRHASPVPQQIDKNTSKNLFYPQGPPLINPLPTRTMSMVNTVMNPLLNNHSVCQMKGDATQQFNNVIEIIAQQVKEYFAEHKSKSETEEKEPHHFINSVLEVGNNYNVLISHIDDGPWSFSIQLVSSESELQKLMEELSSTTLVPLKPPIILGHPCIACSRLYGNLCRGVVVSISHSSVKVYFVDFGNTEDLPSLLIYELPSRFFKYQVLSQKFSLSGLEKVTYSDDIKKFFKEVVQNELLMLRVVSLKGDNLPTCELYFKDKNIKRFLNEKIRELRISSKDDFPKVNDMEDVTVTWIVSPQKFFVQLHKRDAELNKLKKELAIVEKKGQKIPFQQLAVGLRCICQYESDGQWYRAVITDIDSENEITVFYIDYGNTEKVSVSNLRKIDGSCLINQMTAQAIQCSLKGFENKPVDQEISNKLEELILEKELKMKVVSSEGELLCVQLFNGKTDLCLSLLTEFAQKIDSKIPPSSVIGRDKDFSVNSQINQTDMSQWENFTLKNDRLGGRNFQNGRNRGKPKGRKFNDFKSKNSASCQQQLIRRVEDKGKVRGDKSFSNKFKNDKESQWNCQRFGKSSRDLGREDGNPGSQGFRQDRGNWDNRKMSNFEDKKALDGERGGRRFEKRHDWEKSSTENYRKLGTADDRSNWKSDQCRSSRKPIRQENIAPPGSRFQEKAIDIGTCERGIITYYFSPDEFYVQLLSQEEEFKKMMQDIQVYYHDKYSLRNPVQAGDIVIAEFSLDKILYRAEVIRPTPVTVRYVDYGNRELVASKGIWAVDKQFVKLPQQVIQCRLLNIQPIGSDWPPPGSAVDKFFEKEEYKVTFTGYKDGVYEVVLEAVGSETDVTTEIIAAGLGQPKTVATVDIPKIDYNLLPSQVLRLYVTQVVSPSKFYVIIDPQIARVVDSEIKTYVESQKVLTPLEKSVVKTGTICLTPFDDDSWCRGIITEIDGNIISVWFSDRGDDIKVTPEKLKRLPGYLAEIEPQAVECCLDGVTTVEEEEEEFRKIMEYRHHLFSVVSAVDNKLCLALFNEDGQKSEFQKHTNHPEEIQPIGDLPILVQKLPLVVSHVDTPNEIYIQRSSDWDDLDKLTNQLSEFYAEEKDCYDLDEIGKLVAAKSVEYELWYRGQLISSSDDGFEVFYIDYGNREVLPRDNIKKLDASFLSYSRFAKKVALDVEVTEEVTEEVKNKLLEITLEKEFFGYFVNSGGEFICELLLNEERISHMLKMESVVLNETDKFGFLSVNLVETTPPVQHLSQHHVQKSDRDESDTQVNESDREESCVKVFISHIDSPKQFWAHEESMIIDLQQFQDKLQKISETLPEKQSLDLGDVVAVLFSGAWYRAKVIALEGRNITIQVIDYGNTVVVDRTENAVKELTPEILDVPVFANCYGLQGNWTVEATAKFEEIILSSEDPVSVITLEDGEPTLVDLFQNGKSICEKLVQEGVACEYEEESHLPTVYITYVVSPNDFYVQRETSSEIHNSITEQLSEAGSFKSPSEVLENETYVARFPEDGMWYRAKIIEKCPGQYKVNFIDYGNDCNVNEIRELPNGLGDIPYLAEHCSLLHGKTSDVWSEEACEKFAEYTDGREFKMKVLVNRRKKSIVKLFYEGKNVTKELEKLCEDDGRSEVYVTNAISPTKFYLQYVNDEDLEAVTKMLKDGDEFEDLEDRQPGILCVAVADDGHWYRAEILKTLNEGCEVLFIDSGKVSVSNELKKMPPEVKEIPPRALKCSFDLPEANLPESVKQEFANLTMDSSSIFRARIITPGEVNVVSLKLDGRILEESLWDDHFPGSKGQTTNSIEGTDDDKKSKLQNNYLNLEDDERASSTITNETDEEKRVKIGITIGEEGFKCDDEKGSEALSSIVNATDNELIEGSQNGDEEPDILEVAEQNEKDPEELEETEDENRRKYICNKAQKIVPGCVSRGEEETIVDDSRELTWEKLKHSEKVVPGSISRGISLDRMPTGDDDGPTAESTPRPVSQSAPSTPKFSRRHPTNGYVKISPNDRLVPGCISSGIPLQVRPFVEKIPSTEKIIPGAVNGSTVVE